LIDKVTDRLKFSKAIMKKEMLTKENYKSNSKYKKERNLAMSKEASVRFEVEEEAKTNANNGLPQIREYD
jgi:hypothetical protein